MIDGSTRHRRIRLVAGPPGGGPGGIEDCFVEAVRHLKKGDPLRPLVVVTGSNPLRLHLSRQLAIRLGGHANIQFSLLKDVARDLGSPLLAGRGRRRLPEFGRDLLLREAVRMWAHGTYFQRIAGREGFLEVIGATIRDLKEAEVEPAALRATAAGLRPRGARRQGAASGELLAGKMEDLANLYEAYDDLLRDRHFFDDEDLMKAAASVAAPASPGVPPAAIVYGFYDLNGLQRSLLREWMAFREGIVFVPFERGTADDEVWDFAAPLLAWLGTWIPEKSILEKPPQAAAGDGMPETRYLSVPGEAREATEAVRWLARIGRERSLPSGHLALLYRAPDPYLRMLPEIFERAGGMPWYGADGLPMASSQAARALMLLLEAGQKRLERRPVIDALVVAGEPRAAEWERLSREAGVTAGADVWSARLARVSGESAAALSRRVGELSRALSWVPEHGTWASFAEAAIHLVETFVAATVPVEALIGKLAGLSSLDEVASPIDRELFLSVLSRALESWRDPAGASGHFQRSGVFVGSVMEARLLSFHAVALVGMVEKVFPAPPRQDPILLDEERERLNAVLGADRLPLKAARHREERLLFRLARATAGEALALLYPRIDASAARPRMPSPFLLALEAELLGRPAGFGDLERSPRMRRPGLAELGPSAAGDAIFSREFDMAALTAAARPDADAAARPRPASFLHAQPILHRALQAEAARWEESRFTAHDGVVMKASLLEDLARLHPIRSGPISPSAVESYASCPLRYMFSRVLGLSKLQDPAAGEGLDPLRRGALIHRILEDLYSGLKGRGWLPLSPSRMPQAIRLLREIATARFAVEERAAPVGYALLWEIDKRGIVKDLETLLRTEAEEPDDWQPMYFEMAFGDKDDGSGQRGATFQIRPGQTVALKGRIDRVDLSRDGTTLRVTDYKTGRLPGGPGASLRGGRAVQLPFYMIAAEQTLAASHPGVTASQGRYLSVSRKGGFKSVVYSGETLRENHEALGQILGTVIREIERGRFFAVPEAETCRNCDFTLACGEGREARFARKRDDRVAAEFIAMREEIP